MDFDFLNFNVKQKQHSNKEMKHDNQLTNAFQISKKILKTKSEFSFFQLRSLLYVLKTVKMHK